MKIDFLAKLNNAEACANRWLRTKGRDEHPREYAIAKDIFSRILRLWATASKQTRTDQELADGWFDYWVMALLCQNPQHRQQWLEFAESWYQHHGDFLPSGWPEPDATRYNNFLHAALWFSLGVSALVNDSFDLIDYPKKRQSTEAFLAKINNAFNALAVDLSDAYYDIAITDQDAEAWCKLLERERGLYVRRLRQKAPQAEPAQRERQLSYPDPDKFIEMIKHAIHESRSKRGTYTDDVVGRIVVLKKPGVALTWKEIKNKLRGEFPGRRFSERGLITFWSKLQKQKRKHLQLT
ncbi:MAG TPA: hypothetical protein VMW24_13110 [Sedimentisphaerales bacterium]|nr:hypothetical protein [Sedimentisphaerales bacterium]